MDKSTESIQEMTDSNELCEQIERRWHTNYDRGVDDYTDEGCRLLAAQAFKDVPVLLAKTRELEKRLNLSLKLSKDLVDEQEKASREKGSLNPQPLYAHIESLQKASEHYIRQLRSYEARIQSLEAENERLRNAL